MSDAHARRAVLSTLLAESVVTDDALYRASKLSPVIDAYRSIVAQLCRKKIICPLEKWWVLTDRQAAKNLLAEDMEVQ